MLRYWWHTRVSLVSLISILFVHWLREEEDRAPSYGSPRSSRYVNTWNEEPGSSSRTADRPRCIVSYSAAICLRDPGLRYHDDTRWHLFRDLYTGRPWPFPPTCPILRERIFRRLARATVPVMTVERARKFRRHRKPVPSRSLKDRTKIFGFFSFYLDRWIFYSIILLSMLNTFSLDQYQIIPRWSIFEVNGTSRGFRNWRNAGKIV